MKLRLSSFIFLASFTLLALLFLSGCDFQESPRDRSMISDGEENVAMPKDCEGLFDPYKDICLFEIAHQDSQQGYCNLIADKNVSLFCYGHVAKKKEKKLIQEAVKKDSLRACSRLGNRLYPACVARLAKEKEDITLCKESGILEDSCELAIVKITGDENICEGKLGESSALCYQAAAHASGRGELCAEIVFDTIREACYLELALKNKDNSLCEKSSYADFCEVLAKGNPQECKRFKGEARENCFRSFALDKKDVTFCKQLKGDAWDSCIIDLAAIIQDESLCESTAKVKHVCLNSILLAS